MNKPKRLLAISWTAIGALFGALPVSAAPILGSDLASFAVLGATGVTNVPTSTIGGNLGSAPNATVGGGYIFSSGSLQPNTALAQAAQLDLDAAIGAVNSGAALPGNVIAAGDGNLDAFNGGVFAPGTYDVGAGTSNLVTAITLDGGGSNTAVWRFRFSSTFIMSEGSDVNLINVGDGAGVGIYWSVGSAATLDGDTLVGNVFANQLISSNGGLTLGCGRLASAESQVTLIKDTISIGCGDLGDTGYGSGGYDQGVNIGSGGTGGSGGQVVPEPGSLLLAGIALAGLFGAGKRKGQEGLVA
ncbi:MAG: ice-binding family protein [Rubrivivax sp.]|nr:ice-binding family protein [Rubrivivax sp.]